MKQNKQSSTSHSHRYPYDIVDMMIKQHLESINKSDDDKYKNKTD